MTVDSTDKINDKAAAHKAKREERKAKTKAGLTHNNQKALPVMTRREQTERLHALKAQFLKSNRLEPFIKKLFDIAMDDDHPGQLSAMKMVADRILPTAGFAGEDKKSSAVNINITGLQVETSTQVKEVDQSEPVSIQ